MPACLAFALTVICTPSPRAPDLAGDWPMLRHDVRLTGRSPAKGHIRKPEIAAELSVGTWEGLAVVQPAAHSSTFSAPDTGELSPDYLSQHTEDWNTDGLGGRDANIHPGEPERAQMRWAKLLPDVDGLQKVEFEDAFSGQPTQVGRLFAFDQGADKPRLVWQTEPEKDMYSPTLLIVDADADGLSEVVVATHYRVMVYNGQTGAKKTELRWHGMRNYGFFGCFTLPGERYPKFVVIADFVSHIDVLDNDGKNLKVLWRKDIEPTIIRKQKVTRPGPNPIADIDGDGRPEITLNIYNDTGDKLWHVISYDAATGDVRFDLRGQYLNGLADVDADAVPELFLQSTRGLAVPEFAPIRVISLKGGRERVLWKHNKARWQTTSLAHIPLTANTAATDGRRTVLLGGGPQTVECYAAAPIEGGRRQALMILGRAGAQRWDSKALIKGPAGARLEAKAVSRPDGAKVLLWWRTSDPTAGTFEARKAQGRVVSWHRAEPPAPVPIVARLRPSETPTVLFDTGNDEIAAYQRVGGGRRLRWRVPGRGVSIQGSVPQGPLAADVDADGELEVLVSRASASGEAELAALNPDAKTKWARVFPGFDGSAPIWNRGGITLWTVGSFTTKMHKDVFVTLRRSTMHSDEGYCLSGKDGRVLWRRDAVAIPGDTNVENWRGYAGHHVAAADVDGDGLDEIICCYPDRFWIASGKTGEMRVVEDTSGVTFPQMWVAYGTPILADFLGGGGLQVLWGGSGYLTALLGTDGKPMWFGAYLDGPSALQSIGDVEGTGRLFVGGAGYKDGFRCYDPVDGKVKWTFALPAGQSSGPTICADVDADGVEEFLFTHGRTLYALNGRDGKPNLIWSLDLPANPGAPAYGDADGDGSPEILVGGSDGIVRILGTK